MKNSTSCAGEKFERWPAKATEDGHVGSLCGAVCRRPSTNPQTQQECPVSQEHVTSAVLQATRLKTVTKQKSFATTVSNQTTSPRIAHYQSKLLKSNVTTVRKLVTFNLNVPSQSPKSSPTKSVTTVVDSVTFPRTAVVTLPSLVTDVVKLTTLQRTVKLLVQSVTTVVSPVTFLRNVPKHLPLATDPLRPVTTVTKKVTSQEIVQTKSIELNLPFFLSSLKLQS